MDTYCRESKMRIDFSEEAHETLEDTLHLLTGHTVNITTHQGKIATAEIIGPDNRHSGIRFSVIDPDPSEPETFTVLWDHLEELEVL